MHAYFTQFLIYEVLTRYLDTEQDAPDRAYQRSRSSTEAVASPLSLIGLWKTSIQNIAIFLEHVKTML